jgi:hypothetical protein
MARTRIPRPLLPPCADPRLEPELEPETRRAVARAETPPPSPPPPLVAQRRSQRFGIFLTAANGSAGGLGPRRRSLTVPRSGP